jgi:hypothetical protein
MQCDGREPTQAQVCSTIRAFVNWKEAGGNDLPSPPARARPAKSMLGHRDGISAWDEDAGGENRRARRRHGQGAAAPRRNRHDHHDGRRAAG